MLKLKVGGEEVSEEQEHPLLKLKVGGEEVLGERKPIVEVEGMW